MKKLTLFTALLVSVIGFGQTTNATQGASSVPNSSHEINLLGQNTPLFYSQQKSNIATTPSSTIEASVMSMGQNNPRYYNNSSVTVKPNSTIEASVMSMGQNNPHFYYNNKSVTVEPSSTEANQASLIGQNLPVFVQKKSTSAMSNLPLGREAELEIEAARLLQGSPFVIESLPNSNKTILADIIPNAGATESFAVSTGDFFYDPSDGTTGGPGGDCTTTSSGDPGDYPNCGCVTITTLTGTDLEVNFLSFNIFGDFDWINIYDGADTSAPQIYDSTVDGDNLADMMLSTGTTFTSTSDALTFEFNSTTVVNTCGWEVEVLNAGGGGGGGGGPCASSVPSNAFENGKSFTMNLGRIAANDITVSADEDFTLEVININSFIGATGSGVNASAVDVYIYDDAGGTPGALITSELGMVPASQTLIGGNFGFDAWDVELDIADVALAGQAGAETTYWVGISLEATDGSNVFWENSTINLTGYGEGYDDGTGGGFVIDPLLEGVYTFAGTCTPMGGGSTYDDCAGAIALACGDSVVGETLTATDSGGNPAADVFYKFTGSGSAQIVTISLCGGGTDYDSVLRVFDDCNLANELAFNDDSCGLQSEVSFMSDGTATYYIMVEGFGTNTGNFSLDVTCEDPLPNDLCDGAIAISCGDSISGTTISATVDDPALAPDCGAAVDSPGVWYSLTDDSGLAGDITVSLCNGTAFDTKLSVYTGDCSAPPLTCVTANDDSCGLQSEVTFASDGNTTFLILVHAFGGATGDFTLDVTCLPTPPPNDMIVNSIDVDEIGFPYTDPAVAMPAATTEDGNPVNCDLTGANGVWYNFVPDGDGTATATIVTPGGASSVTFYTAPNETAVETDLTLVDQFGNQCGPGTTANIFTLAGQAYYVFVMNTGAITDIVIDGTNLGVADNTIEGFSYYPNPTADVLTLQALDNIEDVVIYNLLGQKVIEDRVEATTSQVDVSALTTGAYIMKVTVNGQTGTYKVIKN